MALTLFWLFLNRKQGLHILTKGVVLPLLLLYLPKFPLKHNLAGGKFIQFRFQLFRRRKSGEPGLSDLPDCCLEQDDLALKATQEFFPVLCRLVAVIDGLQFAVGIDLLSQEGKVGDPLLRIPQVLPSTDGGSGNGVAPFH